MLQAPQVIILNLELPIKDHQSRQQANNLILLLHRLRIVLLEALPRQRLTAREQQQEEAATA